MSMFISNDKCSLRINANHQISKHAYKHHNVRYYKFSTTTKRKTQCYKKIILKKLINGFLNPTTSWTCSEPKRLNWKCKYLHLTMDLSKRTCFLHYQPWAHTPSMNHISLCTPTPSPTPHKSFQQPDSLLPPRHDHP